MEDAAHRTIYFMRRLIPLLSLPAIVKVQHGGFKKPRRHNRPTEPLKTAQGRLRRAIAPHDDVNKLLAKLRKSEKQKKKKVT